MIDRTRRAAAVRAVRGESAIVEQASPDAFDRAWEEERRAQLLTRALDVLRRETGVTERNLRAFEMTTREGRSVEEASSALGVSRNVVYMARNDCLRRLREISDRLDAMWDAL